MSLYSRFIKCLLESTVELRVATVGISLVWASTSFGKVILRGRSLTQLLSMVIAQLALYGDDALLYI